MSQERLEQLFQSLAGVDFILIVPHTNPDPDSIASAVALRYLLAEKLNVEGQIVYEGIIGRAENKALVRYLVHPLRPVTDADWSQGPVVIIDTQPGAGNIIDLPAEADVAAVIDHHTWTKTMPLSPQTFLDIRTELGATSTMLTEYLQAAALEPPIPLATALFYGIKTNTMSLGRNASVADAMAYYYLQPRIDVKGLAGIEQARVSAHYFKSFDKALRAAQLYNGILISYVGLINYPDLTAEMADLLLRLEESDWVICMGLYADMLMISVRLHRQHRGAGQLVQAIVRTDGTAGGHGTIAGGQIPLAGRDPDELVPELISRALEHLRASPELPGTPLFE